MNSSEVLEAVLLSKADHRAEAMAPISFTIFDGHRKVVRMLLQKANCARIARTLVNFVRRDRRDYHKGWEKQTIPNRYDGDISHNRITNSITSNRNLLRSTDDFFLSRLRRQLLRMRVTRQLGQDFVMSKQMVELQALFRQACTLRSDGLSTDAFRDIWDMLEQRRGKISWARHRGSQSACSLSEDAAAISKARNILQQAASKGHIDDEDGERGSRRTINQSRSEEFTHHVYSSTISSPADVLPLLVLAEALGVYAAVNACLDLIEANQEEVIKLAQTLFDPAFDWARVVARLVKWPRVAKKSSPPLPFRSLQSATFPPEGKIIETVSAHVAAVEGSTCHHAESRSVDGGSRGGGVNRRWQDNPREGFRPPWNVDRGQLLGKEKTGQTLTLESIANIDGSSNQKATMARITRQDVILETSSGERQVPEVFELETQPRLGDSLLNGSAETSCRLPPTPSPTSLPQQPSLQADRSDEEGEKKCYFKPREPGSCAVDHTKESEGYHRRSPARVHSPNRSLGRLLSGEEVCGRDYADSDRKNQQVCKRAERDADAALESSFVNSLANNHQRNEPVDSIEDPDLRIEDRSLYDHHFKTTSPESGTTWSSEKSIEIALMNPTSVMAVAFDSATPRLKRDSHQVVEMHHSQLSRGVTNQPRTPRDARASPVRQSSLKPEPPMTTEDSGAAVVVAREYESSCALARKRALLRVRLARQMSALAAAEATEREKGCRADRRQKRADKVAELVLKTSGVAAHGYRSLESCSRTVQRSNGDVGERDGVNQQGKSPMAKEDSARLLPSRTTEWNKNKTPDCKEDEENEEAPRRPLNIEPVKLGIMGWQVGKGRKTGSRGKFRAHLEAEKSTAAETKKHHAFSDYARTSGASSALVVRIDTFYSIPTRGSCLQGGGDDVSNGTDRPSGEACAGVYLRIISGRLKHRTAAQHPECCKRGTCRGLGYRREGGTQRTRAVRVSAVNADLAWVFNETVILRDAPERSPGRTRFPSKDNLQVLVYSDGGGQSAKGKDPSSSRDCRSAHVDSLGAAPWALVGMAILPLRGRRFASGDPVDDARDVVCGECTFSRSMVVSVQGVEGELPMGWVEMGVCGTTASGQSCRQKS